MVNSSHNANELNGVIILGSARSDGNTRLIADRFAEMTGLALTDLNDWNIGFFDYDLPERNDDFLPLIRQLLHHDILVFATPVYWYNMSAIMKNFFDRITDLLKWHKDLGRELRGKTMAVVSCSASAGQDDNFARPFRSTANYLGMHFGGYAATWLSEGVLPADVTGNLENLAAQLRIITESNARQQSIVR